MRCLIILCTGFLLSACQDEAPILSPEVPLPRELVGETMGTTWKVRIPGGQAIDRDLLTQTIEAELELVNGEMSNWIKTSELSMFNTSEELDWVPVAEDTARVCALARQISEQTDGAYDVTIAPLVRLWGFGPGADKSGKPPAEEAIAAAQNRVGYAHYEVRLDPPALRKAQPALELDLSSIAKGHGVDRVSERLIALRYPDHFVEIGGEVLLRGEKAPGVPWVVGIEKPAERRQDAQVAMMTLTNAGKDQSLAVATSGNYRNYFESEGRRFAHLIDPRTGRPVPGDLASVTVVATRCDFADGWATALSVLGSEEALQRAEALGLAAMLVKLEDDGRFTILESSAFQRMPR